LDVQIHRPGVAAMSLLQAMGRAGQELPHWQANLPVAPISVRDAHTPVASLNIELQAPCHINSMNRRSHQADHALPFTLVSIVRSVQRRMQHLEPGLAAQCGFQTPEWQAAMKTIWPHRIAQPELTDVASCPWPYVSRNTPGHAPVWMPGLQGRLHYQTPLPAMVAQVLDIGQWIGIGQKTSLGMGWYGVGIELNEGDGNG
jgi:hypothetical protein